MYMGTVPPVLRGMVTVVYSGPRYMWIPMDSSPVQWDSHLCIMDSDGRLGHE